MSQLRAPCLRCGLSANLCCKAWSHEAQTHRPNPWRVMSRIGKHMVRGSELRSLMTWTFYERDRWVCHGVLRASTSCASNAGKRAGRRCYIVLCFCRLVARRVLAACRWRTPDEATAIAGAGPLFAPFTLSTEIGLAGVDVSHAPKRASFQISGHHITSLFSRNHFILFRSPFVRHLRIHPQCISMAGRTLSCVQRRHEGQPGGQAAHQR